MNLYHDPYSVVTVYSGLPARTSAIMPFVIFDAPPATYMSNQQHVESFQVFPTEPTVAGSEALGLVTSYYNTVSRQKGALSIDQAKDLFMATDFTVPQAFPALLIPGDAAVLPWAGMFLTSEQIAQSHALKATLVVENTPVDASSLHFTQNGSVVMTWTLRGTVVATGVDYSCLALDYFQIVQTAAGLRIGRMTRFFDTYAVTMALTGNVLFPQISPFSLTSGTPEEVTGSTSTCVSASGAQIAILVLLSIVFVMSLILLSQRLNLCHNARFYRYAQAAKEVMLQSNV